MRPTHSPALAALPRWELSPASERRGQVRRICLVWCIPLFTTLALALFWIAITPSSSSAAAVAQMGHLGNTNCERRQGAALRSGSSGPALLPQPGPVLIVNTTLMTTTDNVCDVDTCTLREAIRLANTLPGANTIELQNSAVYTLTDAEDGLNGLPLITSTVTINGHGSTIARSTAAGTVAFRLLQTSAQAVVQLNGITLKNGNAPSSVPYGGGVFNSGRLSADECLFSDNHAQNDGGGIYTHNAMTITNSTFAGNTADVGAGIEMVDSRVFVANSTFYGNNSEYGSAIDEYYNSTSYPNLSLLNSTLAGNQGTYVLRNNGGGTITAANTIFANNLGGLCYGTITDIGGNLREAASDCPGSVGLAMLGPLADNGGATPTRALLDGSDAINQGSVLYCPGGLVAGRDQRGVSRPQGRICDSGAYELEAQPGPTYTVNNTAGSDDGLCSPADCTLREAIDEANRFAGETTIELGAGQAYTLTEDGYDLNGLPPIDGRISINGHGSSIARSTTAPVFRIFMVEASGALTLTRLTIANGKATNFNYAKGAGVYNLGRLVVSECTFTRNVCDADTTFGGALYNYNGSVSIHASTFYSNSATSYMSFGGALYSSGGVVNITNSTFADNQTSGNTYSQGGAIYNASSMTVTNSTFSGNRAKDGGGALFNFTGPSLSLRNTIVANSLGSDNCGGTVIDGGGNFTFPVDDDSCPGFRQDPKLGRLANNGGWTQTLALLTGSPAIHHAVLANCPATDQRGWPRRLLDQCDSGAYEWAWRLFQPLIRK